MGDRGGMRRIQKGRVIHLEKGGPTSLCLDPREDSGAKESVGVGQTGV